MDSILFGTDRYKKIEEDIRRFLNEHPEFLSEATVKSTRAVGDAIKEILGANCEAILGPDVCSDYRPEFARRAMADFAFKGTDGFHYAVDVKTHRESTQFNMPNLTSAARLAEFYEESTNFFVILMVAYDVSGTRAEVSRVTFVPIEFLGWDSLTLGALGKGQIQIANSRHITINPGYSRRKWMLELCAALREFYPKEIVKIKKRMEYFEQVRSRWEASAE